MRQSLFLCGILCASMVACTEATYLIANEVTVDVVALEPMTAIRGLKTPESVVQTQDGRIYVTEINGFDVDGDGQITVIENGQAKVFVSGLDDPKGIVAKGEDLYVTDKTKVLKINPRGQVTVFADANDFPSTPVFLNDIELDTLGNLYVSDSGDLNEVGRGSAIYKINPQGEVSLVINSAMNPLVQAPNGLLMDDTGNVILFVDFATGILYSYNMETLVLTEQATGFGGGDGLVHHSSGAMFVSDWKNGKVFVIDALEGEVKEIKAGYQAAADIALTKDERYLMVPDFKAGVLDFIEVSAHVN
jgi:gluconolactonase